MLDLFDRGVELVYYCLQKSFRSDCGGENVAVWRRMIASHNYDYSLVITGSSVHNERVERLWRDVNRCVGSDIFRELETNSMLNPLNETDLYTVCITYSSYQQMYY